MLAYTHVITNMDEYTTRPLIEVDEDVMKPRSELNIKDDGIERKDEDYEYQILKPNHFKIVMLSKVKGLLQNEDPNLKIRE